MLSDFRIVTNPKQDTEAELPRQQEEPWMINDEDLEKNKSKVWYYCYEIFSCPLWFDLINPLCGFQSLRQIRLNEVLHDYSRDAALIVMWVKDSLSLHFDM